MQTILRTIFADLAAISPAFKLANIELLKATMRAKSQHYDQSDWWTVTSCGATCCMAGWAYILKHGHDVNDRDVADQSGLAYRLRAEARAWLGLSAEQASVLFAPAVEWPERFAFDDGALTKMEEVEKACELLDFIVAGGSVSRSSPAQCEYENDDEDLDDEDLLDEDLDDDEDEEEELKGGLLAVL